ncbi:MAG: hypothetical protein PVF65_03390 [Sphingomonadales bacterium]|jgi:hypothetical protein
MAKPYKNTMESNCHCGNIQLVFHTNKQTQDFTPRTCQCSHCRGHGANWISDPEGEVRLKFQNPEDVNSYQFGHKTADFILCKNCGVLMISICEIDGRKRGGLNSTATTNIDFPSEPVNTHLGSETIEGRLERRAKNWIGNVIFET